MDKIPNTHLIESDLPSRHASWTNIQPFASTFDGYEYWGSFKKCREVAQQGLLLFRDHQDLAQSLTDLRTCLFFEARRWRHFEKKPSKKGMDYIHALIEAIRLLVKARNYM